MFEHVPGFRIMREPEKFSALVLLAYAFLFGAGFDSILRTTARRRARVAVAVSVVAVVCVYTFRMFGGFGDYVAPSSFPRSWSEAQAIMGDGPEKILALPGDQYVSFPWTQDRAVANPMPSFFSRDVIADGALGLADLRSQTSDARGDYLAFITAHGGETSHFGRLIAPLDVRFVLWSTTGSWAADGWLREQDDLRLVRAWPDLELFENLEPVSSVYAPHASVTLHDWGEVVGLADTTDLTDLAIHVERAAPGVVRRPLVEPATAPASDVSVERSSPVGYVVRTTDARVLVTADPFDAAWHVGDARALPQFGVTTSVDVRGAGPVIDLAYGRWTLVRASYVVSAVFIGCCTLIGIRVRRRGHRRILREVAR
jgi:hypothetical protein